MVAAELSGCPNEVAKPKSIEKVHDMLLVERRLEVREIVKALGISHDTVLMSNNQLFMRVLTDN